MSNIIKPNSQVWFNDAKQFKTFRKSVEGYYE